MPMALATSTADSAPTPSALKRASAASRIFDFVLMDAMNTTFRCQGARLVYS